jgi:hypothetical protein
MRIKIPNNIFYQILFLACVTIPYLNHYELTFAIWGLTALITLQKSYSLSILKLVSLFVLILLIALFSSITEVFTNYEFLRDFAYLLKPILGLLVGYNLCKGFLNSPLKLIVYVGVFIAAVHLFLIVYSFAFLPVNTMHQLRGHTGYFSDFEVYALILLVFSKEFEIDFSPKITKRLILLVGFSVFMYLARSNFIQFGILFLAIKGYFKLNKKSITIIVSTILILVSGYWAIVAYNPDRGAKGIEALLFKIKNSPNEAFKTRVNKNDWKDFNDNYRSYETILTLRQVPEGGIKPVLVGEGLGSSIDLKRKVWLHTSMMRFIPFLHNGFMTIFLKSGLAGVLILLVSIGFMFKNQPSSIPLVININYVLMGTGIYLLLSYWVFMGFYFTVDTKSLVVGLLIALREKRIKTAVL